MLHRSRLLLIAALACPGLLLVRPDLLAASQPAALQSPAVAQRPLLVLVSIDGLRPDAVLEAEAHGMHLPNLRALMRDGSYAEGVTGVLPTMTYPSHMTLMTGAVPARHGIYTNTTFDPLGHNDGGWYWYAEDGRAQTLWDAASQAKLTTGNIYWPTSVGAQVTYNLPQIWRSGTADDRKLQHALSTPGLEAQLGEGLGTYPAGDQETVEDDAQRTRYAQRLIETRRPDFTTVYLTGLDSEQHNSGPFSPMANAALERLDALIGQLRASAERAAPGRAYFCVVSDHGFAAIQHDVSLYPALVQAGLITLSADRSRIVDWQAMPWGAGGSVALMLADPGNAQTRDTVHALLKRLASDPHNGIDKIMDQDELHRRGGFPDAAFLVTFRVGYETGFNLSGPLVTAASHRGMHGYPPEVPEMRSSFFITGPDVPAGQSLGVIDMRAIAPTLADVLHIRLRDADEPVLALGRHDRGGRRPLLAQANR